MKSKLVLIFVFSFLVNTQQAQNFSWAKRQGGTGNDYLKSVIIDNAGNVYHCGIFSGTVDFDPGPGVFNLTATNTDAYVTKLDAFGNFIWSRQLKSDDMSVISYGCVSGNGDLYFTGYFTGSCDFDPGSGTFMKASVNTFSDIFLLKIDATGNFVWCKTMGDSGTDNGASITTDPNGDVLFCGTFESTVDFDPSPAILNLSTTGTGYETFICKFDPSGQFVFAKHLEAAIVNAIAIDVSGNVYTTGAFGGTACDFDPGPSSYTLASSGSTFPDAFVSKLSNTGAFVWARQFSGNGSEEGLGMSVDATGAIVTSGNFNGIADFDPGVGTYTINAGTGSQKDVFINKLDASGNFVWTKSIGSPGFENGYSVCHDNLNNVYTLGSFQYTIDFDPGPGTFTIAATGIDCFLSKLDASGNFISALKFGGPGSDEGISAKVDAYHNIYCGGIFDGAASDFDPAIGTHTFASLGSNDVFIVKLSPMPCVMPQPPVSNSSPVICKQSTSALNVTGTSYFSWYSSPNSTVSLGYGPSLPISQVAPGTYTYYVEANTCTLNPNRTPVSFTLAPLPIINSNAPATICLGETYTLNANGASTYTWNPGGTGVSIIVTPQANTLYTLTGSDLNGCTQTALITVSVNACVGIQLNSTSLEEIQVYPNPSSGELYVSYESEKQEFLIEIMDVQGQRVFTKNLDQSGQKISIDRLINGIYLIRIFKNQQLVKLVKLIRC